MLAEQVYHAAKPYIISRQRYIIENLISRKAVGIYDAAPFCHHVKSV